ncbi:uncharacterized protein LOC122373963 [Amphibalanus amphitrite]|uniref:uncharacterized protein LOC122373963 n=1 Tax=Amphibalanus amphitrite TaxID=1232801 RepID=UPI001C923461|nr:uncharacterized protein LOC122373963 [Amphibalanus amphitrite]
MCRVKLPERVTMCATEEGGSPEDGLLVHPLCDHQSSASCAATVYVNDRPVCALLDSGAAVSMVSRAALELIGTREADVIPSAVSVRGIGGLTNCTGYLEADVALPGDGDPQTECSDAEDVLLPDSRERIPDIASVREHQHQDRLLHELTSHVRQKLTEQELPRELEHFDHFSKWAVAVPVRRKTSAAVAVALEQRVLPVLLRRPARLLTDNGGEFVGPELQEVLRRWGIQQTFSTPYRPQGNGAVERLNRTLSQELRMLSADKPGDWDLHLPKAMATYNGTSHSQLGDSPADFLLKQKHGGVSVPLVSVERQSCWRPGNPSFAPFEVGQLVKRETQRPGNLLTGKFEQRFDGPFKVKSLNSNDVTYTLERDTGAELRAHHTQLRPWITAPSYLRRLEEVREDGEGRGCSMHPPLPAGGVLTSVGSAGERRLPGILKNTRRAQDRSQQTTPPRVSSSAQQTTPPPRVSSSAQQTTPPPKNDGAQLAVSRPPASAPQQRTRATSAAKRTVRFDDVGREIPRRSGRVREAPDRWGYS